MQQKKRLLGLAANGVLIIASISIGYFISNIAFLIYIRSAKQANNFPRQVISQLPAPSRWVYPEIGTGGNQSDLALIGDSYVEGSSDDFNNDKFSYSFAHDLHRISGETIANFGTSGSHLIKQVELYEGALNGEFWPLIDGRSQKDKPMRIMLFFYEGNDLDDYFNEIAEGGNDQQIAALKSSRKYQPLRLFLKSWLVNLFSSISIPGSAPQRPVDNVASRTNSFCMPGYCRTNYQMQSASPNLSTAEIDQATAATANSIVNFAKSNHKKQICVVYIPSPGTIYEPEIIQFEQAQRGSLNRSGSISREENLSRSLRIRNNLRTRLEAAGVPFIDTTQKLVNKAKQTYLHGEGDQKHFGREGNKFFASTINSSLGKCFPKVD